MVNGQSVLTSATDKKSCPVCGQELPIFTEDGKHNFCPHGSSVNQIIDICIKCKLNLTDNGSNMI